MFFHVLKYHRTGDEVPFYCSLCHYKIFNRDQLNHHVTTFAIHNHIKGIRHQGAPDEEFYVRNTNPREIMIGVDLLPQGQQESREVWINWKKEGTTLTVGKAARKQHMKPVVIPKPKPAASIPSAAELIQHLQGKVDSNLLEQAMTLSGILTSPSFSQCSKPGHELEDPLEASMVQQKDDEVLGSISSILGELDTPDSYVSPLPTTPSEDLLKALSTTTLQTPISTISTSSNQPALLTPISTYLQPSLTTILPICLACTSNLPVCSTSCSTSCMASTAPPVSSTSTISSTVPVTSSLSTVISIAATSTVPPPPFPLPPPYHLLNQKP